MKLSEDELAALRKRNSALGRSDALRVLLGGYRLVLSGGLASSVGVAGLGSRASVRHDVFRRLRDDGLIAEDKDYNKHGSLLDYYAITKKGREAAFRLSGEKVENDA